MQLFNRLVKTKAGYYKYSWAEILLVTAVFTKELGTRSAFGIDFDFIGYPFFILYFIIYLRRIIGYNAAPVSLFIYFTVSSVVSIIVLNLSLDGFFKQIIPIIVILSVSFTVLKYRSIIMVFELYVKFTFWTAMFGIVQVLLSYLGVFVLTASVGRLDSIAYEPSHYAALLLPALVYTFFNQRRYKMHFFVMLFALILTYNLTAYLVFLAIFTFVTVHPLYVLVTVPVGYYIFFNILPDFSRNFNIRFSDTLATLSGEKDILTSSIEVNATTLSFYSNYEVAKYTLTYNPLSGGGIGGHEEMYYRHFENTSFVSNYYYGLNAKGAHSLSIRVLSELGIVGSILYIYLLLKNLILFKKGVHYTIAIACVSHFLCKFFKLGGYIDYGTPFFFTILILNARSFRALQPQKLKRARRSNHPVPVQPAS